MVILEAASGKDVIAANEQAHKFIGTIVKCCGCGSPNLAQVVRGYGTALDSDLDHA